MSKSIASSALLPGAILLAVLLAGCSDEPTSSPVAKTVPSSTATPSPVPPATAIATLTPTPTAMPTPTQTAMPTPQPTATAIQTGTPTPELPPYLKEDIPPCTPLAGPGIDPCKSDPNASVNWGQGSLALGSSPALGDAPLPVSHFFGGSISFRPSIVIRGTYLPDTVRCVGGVPYRVPEYVEPGWFQNSTVIECYADLRVNSYIVGSGPSSLTVLVYFDHYFYGDFENFLGEGDTEFTHEEGLAMWLAFLEHGLVNGGRPGQVGIYGREAILFIGPGHNHATETWEVFNIWEMEVRDDDTVIAVHPNRDIWRRSPTDFETHRSKLEMTLTDFTQAAMAAHQALVTANGGRVAPADIDSRKASVDLPMMETDANRLTQFYTSAGAYQHPGGPPSQPEPVHECAGDTAVNLTLETGVLAQHCEALLAGKDTLRGTASLNWAKTVEIDSWNGISIAGEDDAIPFKRVSKVELPNKSLNGSIPAEFGDLLWSTHLDLSGNSLTGEIPSEFSNLTNLQVLKLSGNSLTGCIPVGLKDVPTNDLASLGIPFCQPPPPDNVSAGTPTESSVSITWDAASNVAKYRVEYLDVSVYAYAYVVDDDAITGTSHTVDGLKCNSEYWFGVYAYGDGGASTTLNGAIRPKR